MNDICMHTIMYYTYIYIDILHWCTFIRCITCVTLYNHSNTMFYHQFYGESKVETDRETFWCICSQTRMDLSRNGEY